MKLESKKTIAILGTAGALVAAAMLIDKKPAQGSQSEPVAAAPVVKDTTPAKHATCGDDASAAATMDFARGKLGAAMSAGKILRASGTDTYAAFDLTTLAAKDEARPPLNLALVIDRSGSMAGDKFDHAKEASLNLIGRLDSGDRVALIQYDDAAQVVVSSVRTDAEGKDRLRKAIGEMVVGGSTNLHGGMSLGKDEVTRTFESGQVSRIILLSDGKANTGVVDPVQITDSARGSANHGIRITSVGVGLDYNEDLMESIAEAGRGNYYYVRDSATLESVMAGELRSIQGTVATAVELRLRPSCDGVEIEEVIGYESRREGQDTVVTMSDLFGGDSRKILVKLSVPDRKNGKIGTVSAVLAYKDAKTGESVSKSVALAIEVTDDHAAASDSVNQDVMAQVLKADAAKSMRAAADAYERGDREGALQILNTSSVRLEEKRGRYNISAQAAAPAMGGLADMAAEAEEFEPGSVGGKDLLKKNKAAARTMSKGK